MDNKLPPLTKDSFDGEKYEAPIPKETPLPKKCDHRAKVTLISSTQLKCQCGSGWSGQNIHLLYEALK